MRNDQNKSEFYSFMLQEGVVLPVSLGGARQVVIGCNDVQKNGGYVSMSNQPNVSPSGLMTQYIHVPDVKDGLNPLIVSSNDDMLYFVASENNMLLQIWVIR